MKRFLLMLFVVIFTVLIILIGVGCKEEGAEATAKDKIAFMSNRDGNYQIYIMNVDVSGQVRLTLFLYL